MKDYLVSIIVPVYGVESYLDKCVQSLSLQTYQNIEILLVDDGSPDKCGEMCDRWSKKDSRIISLHKENGGQGTARNMALDICKGDYILFVDSDDEIDLDMVEKLLRPLQDDPYDLIMCGYKINNGISVKNAKWYDADFSLENNELMKRYLVDRLICTAPWCKLFRREIFDGIRFPNFRANEDAYIMHRLLGKCETAKVISDALYNFNLRSDSTEGQKFNPNKLHLIDCAYDLRDYVKENYPMYEQFVQNRVINVAMVLLNRIYQDNAGGDIRKSR